MVPLNWPFNHELYWSKTVRPGTNPDTQTTTRISLRQKTVPSLSGNTARDTCSFVGFVGGFNLNIHVIDQCVPSSQRGCFQSLSHHQPISTDLNRYQPISTDLNRHGLSHHDGWGFSSSSRYVNAENAGCVGLEMPRDSFNKMAIEFDGFPVIFHEVHQA